MDLALFKTAVRMDAPIRRHPEPKMLNTVEIINVIVCLYNPLSNKR